MKLLSTILFSIAGLFISFSNPKKSERLAICNATKSELKIETFPRLNQGIANKSIVRGKNLGDTATWKFPYGIGINAKIIEYDYYNYHDTGRYIMMPKSFFSLGFSFQCGKNNFRVEDLQITYLKVYLPNDTIICNSKKEIVALLTDDKFRYSKGDNIEGKYFRQFEHIIVVK